MTARFTPQPSCPVCGAGERRAVGQRGDRPIPELVGGATPDATVDIVRCRACGHYYCDPLPLPETLAELYAHVHDYFGERSETGPRNAFARIASITGLSDAHLLDIGCGRGELLDAAVTAGWHASGVEPTVSFAEEAIARGLDVHVGYADDTFSGGPYDVVTMFGVLEHVPDPVEILADARRRLKPGGWVFADAPNGHRLEAWVVDRILRLRRHPWTVRTAPLQPPFHLAEFTAASLRLAVERAGLEVVVQEAVAGEVPYPLPEPVATAARALHRIGGVFGGKLNLTVAARRTT